MSSARGGARGRAVEHDGVWQGLVSEDDGKATLSLESLLRARRVPQTRRAVSYLLACLGRHACDPRLGPGVWQLAAIWLRRLELDAGEQNPTDPAARQVAGMALGLLRSPDAARLPDSLFSALVLCAGGARAWLGAALLRASLAEALMARPPPQSWARAGLAVHGAAAALEGGGSATPAGAWLLAALLAWVEGCPTPASLAPAVVDMVGRAVADTGGALLAGVGTGWTCSGHRSAAAPLALAGAALGAPGGAQRAACLAQLDSLARASLDAAPGPPGEACAAAALALQDAGVALPPPLLSCHVRALLGDALRGGAGDAAAAPRVAAATRAALAAAARLRGGGGAAWGEARLGVVAEVERATADAYALAVRAADGPWHPGSAGRGPQTAAPASTSRSRNEPLFMAAVLLLASVWEGPGSTPVVAGGSQGAPGPSAPTAGATVPDPRLAARALHCLALLQHSAMALAPYAALVRDCVESAAGDVCGADEFLRRLPTDLGVVGSVGLAEVGTGALAPGGPASLSAPVEAARLAFLLTLLPALLPGATPGGEGPARAAALTARCLASRDLALVRAALAAAPALWPALPPRPREAWGWQALQLGLAAVSSAVEPGNDQGFRQMVVTLVEHLGAGSPAGPLVLEAVATESAALLANERTRRAGLELYRTLTLSLLACAHPCFEFGLRKSREVLRSLSVTTREEGLGILCEAAGACEDSTRRIRLVRTCQEAARDLHGALPKTSAL
ncbi:hypothetical protein ACKKBG_A09170 [Auxenochlorella protothecoides x Auxenochlorella symbiontica]